MAFKTAAEMRKITEESILSDVECILQEVEKCARQGKYQYDFDEALSLIQRQKLIELGYNVRTGTQYNQPWAIISW